MPMGWACVRTTALLSEDRKAVGAGTMGFAADEPRCDGGWLEERHKVPCRRQKVAGLRGLVLLGLCCAGDRISLPAEIGRDK